MDPAGATFWSKLRKRLTHPGFLGVSIAIHLLFGAGATYFVVSRYAGARKLTFNAGPKSPNPSEQALQHRVQLEKKKQSLTAVPAVPKRVLTTGQAKVSLPAMPDLPMPKTPDAPTMAAGVGAIGFGSGKSGGAAGGTGTGSQINFFGIRDTSTSVLIMIDVSDSMFGRTGDYDYDSRKLVKQGKEQSFQTVRDEASKLIQNLGPNVTFGIVRWSGGAYSWKPELVPATEENKQAAVQHIETEVDVGKAKPRGRPGGTRHDYALEEAFKLKPETIYMLTDGNATAAGGGGSRPQPIDETELYKIVEEGQKTLSKKAKLHVIYYVTGTDKPEEVRMLRGLTARGAQGSMFTKFNAPGRSEGDKKDQKDRKDRKDQDKRDRK